MKLKISFCEDYHDLLCQIRPLENCCLHHHHCPCHLVVFNWGASVTLSQVFYVFPCILVSFHQVKSLSPAAVSLYANLLHLFYGNFDTNSR